MVSIQLTTRNQRLGDLAAGTIVVRERLGGHRAVAPGELRNLYPALDVTAVTAAELAAVRDFLARRDKLTPESRTRVAGALAERIAAKVGGLTAGDLAPEQLLETIAAAKAQPPAEPASPAARSRGTVSFTDRARRHAMTHVGVIRPGSGAAAAPIPPFTAEHEEFRSAVRRFVQTELRPARARMGSGAMVSQRRRSRALPSSATSA